VTELFRRICPTAGGHWRVEA